jgi:predicted transcriptional regulator of viral defense system
MGTYSATDIIKVLQEKQISLFSLTDFGRLFDISNSLNLYKRIQRLEKKGLIQKLTNGKYSFLLNPPDDFLIANFTLQPSYISLESALSFYGIITGFPYQITSISVKKSKNINIQQKEFQYSQIANKLYWGYEKKDDFLIADPEKALLDYIYLGLKGLRNLDFDEMELSGIDRQKLVIYTRRFDNKKMSKIIKKIIK